MRLRALTTGLLVAAPLVVTGLQTPATAAPTITGVSPYRIVEGHSFEVTGKVPPRGRPVILQRQVGKKWKVVDRKRTGPKGRYSFTTGRKLEGCTYAEYRVVAPKDGRRHRVVKAFQEQVIKPGATIVVPAIARPGGRTTIDGYVVPGSKNRPVRLERRANGGRWTTVATTRTGPLGAVTFKRVRVGTKAADYRISASAWHGLRRTTSRSGPITPQEAATQSSLTFTEVSADVQAGSRITHPLAVIGSRYVAFESAPASDPSGSSTDLYLADREAGTTKLIASVPGHQLELTSISGFGRYVAFTSDSPNLVADDTNGAPDVFVYDSTTDQISRQSVAGVGAQDVGGDTGLFLGTDGQFLTFRSAPSAFGAPAPSGAYGVFVRDQSAGRTTPVRPGQPVPGIADSARWSLEAPRRDDPCDLNGATDAEVVNLANTRIRQASPYADHGRGRNEDGVLRAHGSALSGDGHYVAYLYTRADLRTDVYVTDVRKQVTRRVLAGVSDRTSLDISAHGGRIVVSDPRGADLNTMVIDVGSGQTLSIAGLQTDPQSDLGGPSLSANGTELYLSTTSRLVAGDTDDQPDVYVAHLG